MRYVVCSIITDCYTIQCIHIQSVNWKLKTAMLSLFLFHLFSCAALCPVVFCSILLCGCCVVALRLFCSALRLFCSALLCSAAAILFSIVLLCPALFFLALLCFAMRLLSCALLSVVLLVSAPRLLCCCCCRRCCVAFVPFCSGPALLCPAAAVLLSNVPPRSARPTSVLICVCLCGCFVLLCKAMRGFALLR